MAGAVSLSEYREIGDAGAYPKWLRELRGKSGVYVIRKRGWFSSPVVYVGESHEGRLYETLIRHFSRWRRKKKFWGDMRGNTEHDPGVTYNRGDVDVAIEVTPAKKAIDRQDALIRKLDPRDNVVARDDLDKVPF